MEKKIVGVFVMMLLVSTSLSVALSISNSQVTVTITSPNDGDVVSGAQVLITADANADLGVSMVQFEIEGEDYSDSGFDVTAPYEYTWSTPSDTNGYFAITATAYDNGGSFVSDRIIVYLNNVDKFAFSGVGNDLDNSAITDEIFTSPGNLVGLTLWHKCDIDSDDVGEIYVKKVGDENWENIESFSNTNIPDWEMESVGIPFDYSGETIQIKFRYVTDSESTSDGWSILGFFVDESMIDMPPYIIYSENFGDYNVGDPWGDWVIVNESELDNIPPVTTKEIGDPKWDDGRYVTSETTLKLTARDNPGGSGVKTIYYRIWYKGKWSEWKEYTGQIKFEGDGPHIIEYYAEDKKGNKEKVHNQPHIVDNLPPTTFVTKDPLIDWYVPDKWALICASDDNNSSKNREGHWFVASALQAYYTLKNHGYDDEHIILILCNNTQTRIHLDNLHINLLNGPDGIQGTVDDPVIDYNLSHPNATNNIKNVLGWGISELGKVVKPGDEVLIYLTDHGYIINETGKKHYSFFCFEDDSVVNETIFADWINWLDNNCSCSKLVIIGDFCHSGCFLDTVQSDAPNIVSGIDKPGRILISSTGRDCEKSDEYAGSCKGKGWASMRPFWNPSIDTFPGDFAGCFFSYPFWKAINGGASYSDAFDFAKAFKPNTDKTVDEWQRPQMIDRTGHADQNSPTQFETVLEGGMLGFNPIDWGGVSFELIDESYPLNNGEQEPDGEYNRSGDPVGVNHTKYRIWYDGSWSSWEEYTDKFSINGEGIHYIEWYSIDYLGNTEKVKNNTIFVDNTIPVIPDLISPVNGETTFTAPKFDWSDVDDVSDVYYTLQIGTDNLFTNIVLEKTKLLISEYSVMKEEALSNGDYYWRVRAIDGLGQAGGWSDIWSFTASKVNSAPNKPDKPSGSRKGNPGELYTYSSSTIDVDGDRVQYIFSWGDQTQDYTFWYDSGETVSESHIWDEKGEYSIKVKAIDEHGYESEWSDPLSVSMPKSKAKSIYTPFLKFLQNHPILYKILQLL